MGEVKIMWHSFHVYIHDYKLLDEYLQSEFEHLICNNLQSDIDYFFIRYWLGGPHIRLRIKENVDFDAKIFLKILKKSVDNFLSYKTPVLIDREKFYTPEMLKGEGITEVFWKEHGTVELDEYKPEIPRYGGERGIYYAEKLFVQSSKLAQKLNKMSFSKRLFAAIDLLYFSFEVKDKTEMAQKYCDLWEIYHKNESSLKMITSLTSRRVSYLKENRDKAFKIYEEYIDLLKNNPTKIMFSHIHMTNNRIGVYPELEYCIAKSIQLA